MTQMDIVDAEVVTDDLTADEARALTDRIKGAAEQLWALLLEAHERHAWTALGYPRWEDYVRAEFDMGRTYAHYLLDQGRVIRQLTAAAGAFTPVNVTEAEARDIKPALRDVTQRVQERVMRAREAATPPGVETPFTLAPAVVEEVVREVVEEVRAEVRQKQQDRAAIEELNALAPPGFDAKADEHRMLTISGLFDALDEIKRLPAPGDFLPLVPDYSRFHFDDIAPAITWLSEMRDLLEEL